MQSLSTLTTSVEYLRPVAVEGDTLASFFTFIPLSLVTIAVAAYARSAMAGAVCNFWPSSCRSANHVPAYPISLGIPANRLHPLTAKHTWVGYASCSSQTTSRIYEVIAAGGLPYVANLDECPKFALHRAPPKTLLAKIRALPFLPVDPHVRTTMRPVQATRHPPSAREGAGATDANAWVLNASSPQYGQLLRAPPSRYEHAMTNLARELHVHARTHLTNAAVAREVVERTLGVATLHSWQEGRAPLRPYKGRTRTGADAAGAAGRVDASMPDHNSSSRLARGGGGDRPRVLVLSHGGLFAQTTSIRDGLSALGALVELVSTSKNRSQVSRWAGSKSGAKSATRGGAKKSSSSSSSVRRGASGSGIRHTTKKAAGPATRRVGSKGETSDRGGDGRRLLDSSIAASLASVHQSAPYALVVVQLGSAAEEEEEEELSSALRQLLHPSNQRQKAVASGGVRGMPPPPPPPEVPKPPHVACVRADDHPPPLWRLWVPSFCNLVFVREMRLL